MELEEGSGIGLKIGKVMFLKMNACFQISKIMIYLWF